MIRSLIPMAILAAVVLAPLQVHGQDSTADPLRLPGDTMTAGHETPASPEAASAADPGFGEMTPERRAQAIEYSDIRNRFFFITTFYSFAVLLALLYFGWSAKIRGWAERHVQRPLAVWFLYFLVLSVVLFLFDFPFEYYTGFALEHRYGQSSQAFGRWLGDLLKNEAVTYVFGGFVIFLVYLAIRRKGHRWWLWVGGFTAPIMAFFIVIAPVVISPLFNKFSPLSNEVLRDKILSLASQAGIPDSRVFEVDASKQSNKYNAYVTGLFGTKRIVLYDTILKDMEDDEILFVMAHEMGHYTMHHVWIIVVGIAIFVLVAAWLTHMLAGGWIRRCSGRWGFSSLGDFASFPLLALLFSIAAFLIMPASNALSRHFEHSSDVYGLKLTGNREAAAKAFEKLAAHNLSNPDPSPFIEFWLYDHPTIKDRVEYVLGRQGS